MSAPRSFLHRFWPVVLGFSLCSCTPQPEQNTVSTPAPLPTVAPSPAVSPTKALPPLAQFSTSPSVLVPGDDGSLHERPLPKAVLAAQSKAKGNRTPVLNQVIRMASAYFPPGTKVLAVGDAPKAFTINLNQAFDNQDFWSQSGETTAQLAVYTLVNNVAYQNAGKGKTMPVQLLIEGKPASTLGEFDASDAIDPDLTLVAKN